MIKKYLWVSFRKVKCLCLCWFYIDLIPMKRGWEYEFLMGENHINYEKNSIISSISRSIISFICLWFFFFGISPWFYALHRLVFQILQFNLDNKGCEFEDKRACCNWFWNLIIDIKTIYWFWFLFTWGVVKVLLYMFLHVACSL